MRPEGQSQWLMLAPPLDVNRNKKKQEAVRSKGYRKALACPVNQALETPYTYDELIQNSVLAEYSGGCSGQIRLQCTG